MQIVLVFNKTSKEKIIIKIGSGASRKKMENEIHVLSNVTTKSFIVTMLFHSANAVGATTFFVIALEIN